MLDKRDGLSSYMTDLLASGRVSFTREEAVAALGVTRHGFLKAAERQQRKGAVLNPRQGFYIVVPPQYLTRGAPPPSWYVDDLMRHERHAYYVGLLEAAELHGATHQAVMQFQIITDKRIPKIRAGRSILSFYFRKEMEPISRALIDRKTDTGRMKISSPELTGLDLLRYAHAAGTIDSIASVLSDLGAKMKAQSLKQLAPAFERSVVQRLGYLLDFVNYWHAAEGLYEYLRRERPLPWVELGPAKRTAKPNEQGERNTRWNVVVRRRPELDQ